MGEEDLLRWSVTCLEIAGASTNHAESQVCGSYQQIKVELLGRISSVRRSCCYDLDSHFLDFHSVQRFIVTVNQKAIHTERCQWLLATCLDFLVWVDQENCFRFCFQAKLLMAADRRGHYSHGFNRLAVIPHLISISITKYPHNIQC